MLSGPMNSVFGIFLSPQVFLLRILTALIIKREGDNLPLFTQRASTQPHLLRERGEKVYLPVRGEETSCGCLSYLYEM